MKLPQSNQRIPCWLHWLFTTPLHAHRTTHHHRLALPSLRFGEPLRDGARTAHWPGPSSLLVCRGKLSTRIAREGAQRHEKQGLHLRALRNRL